MCYDGWGSFEDIGDGFGGFGHYEKCDGNGEYQDCGETYFVVAAWNMERQNNFCFQAKTI